MRAPHFFGDIAPAVVETSTLLHSRRPGILTYTTPLLTTLRTLAGSPLLLAGLSRQEETLNIRLADAHVFTTTPLTAVIEIDTGVSVYDARIKFDARFEGIRWLMYHWRLSSFVVFVGLFWGVEMAAAGALWYWVLAWLEVRGAEVEGETGVEGEELVPEDESETGGSGLRFVDTQRTFPTSSRAPRLGLQEGLYPTPEGTPAPESILASEEWTPESGDSRAGDDEEGDTTEFDDDVEELVTLTTDSGIGASDSTGRRVGETDSMRRRRQRLSTGYGFLSGGGGSPGR